VVDITHEFEDGKALVRHKWQCTITTPNDKPWSLHVETFREYRKNHKKNKQWVMMARWNLHDGGGDKLETCPPIPADVLGQTLAKLSVMTVDYSKGAP
jgi:hypothetical protein